MRRIQANISINRMFTIIVANAPQFSSTIDIVPPNSYYFLVKLQLPEALEVKLLLSAS